jgi:hypothetical protein
MVTLIHLATGLARKAKSDVQSRRPYPNCRGFIIASTPRPGRTLREPTMGRSSGFRINLQATPSHGFQWPQWPMWRSSPVTAAGPQRICTVFPLLRIWISLSSPTRSDSGSVRLGGTNWAWESKRCQEPKTVFFDQSARNRNPRVSLSLRFVSQVRLDHEHAGTGAADHREPRFGA